MTLTDTVTVNGSQPPAGRWLSTHAALGQLGISERTLFRRLAAGKLRRRTLEDGRVQVWLPLTADRQATVIPSETLSVGDRHVAEGYRQSSWSENETAPNGPSVDDRQVSDSDSQSDPERALALLDRFNVALARQLEPLIAEVRASRERNEELARENGQLAERVQELERRAALIDSDHQELEALRTEHAHLQASSVPELTPQPESANGAAETAEESAASNKRAWWRRLAIWSTA